MQGNKILEGKDEKVISFRCPFIGTVTIDYSDETSTTTTKQQTEDSSYVDPGSVCDAEIPKRKRKIDVGMN